MENGTIKTPSWFWFVAIVFLLWNIMGVFSFFTHTFISEEALLLLSESERELYVEYPVWATFIFAIAVFSGFLGSLGLLFKKKWSKTYFIISFLAIIIQMIHNVFFTKSMEVYGPGQTITMPIMIVVFGLFLIWFSNYFIKKNILK